MKWLAAVVVLSGCDVIWRLDHVYPDSGSDRDDGGDVTGDGSNGGRPSFCTDAYVYDDMSSVEPCGTWGTRSGMLLQRNGALEASANGSMIEFAGCSAEPYPALTEQGVFVEVTATIAGSDAYTELEVRNAVGAMPQMTASLRYGGTLKFIVAGVVLHERPVAPAPRWWRIRAAGSFLIAETALDAEPFAEFHSANVGLPSEIAVRFGVGVAAVGPTTGVTKVASFGICKAD
ncbi:MAG TPA: hypothetical protein VIV11_03635 [Kofleriaceae bacterium]